MNKKDLSERDICLKFINPANLSSGWDFQKQVRREVSFTDARIIFQGPFVSTSKADSSVFPGKTCLSGIIEKEISLDEFQYPETLWQLYLKYYGLKKK